MAILYLVRHGEAQPVGSCCVGCGTDLPLTETGRRQGQELGLSLIHIFSQASQELREAKNGQPIAGGTDLLGTLKKNILPEFPDKVVNLKSIPNASYILDEVDKVAVGALTTLSEVESSGLFAGELQAVAQAAHSVATPIIRNTATLGGNLCQDVRCWYYRYPDSVGGRLLCARKGGDQCYACL